MTSSVLQNKIPFFILYSDIDLFTSKDFGSLYFVHNHSPYKTKLNSKSLKRIFLGYSRTKKDYKCFCPSIGRYILFADLTFSSLNMGFPHLLLHQMVTMITYSIWRLNSGESTSETVTCKNPLQFQDPLQTYKDEHFLLLCHRQPQYQTICKNQMRLSPLNNLIILLPMIFPLHFKKTNTLLLSILFPILFLILIYPLLFVHLFHLWTHAWFPRMCQWHYLFQVGLRRCRRKWQYYDRMRLESWSHFHWGRKSLGADRFILSSKAPMDSWLA